MLLQKLVIITVLIAFLKKVLFCFILLTEYCNSYYDVSKSRIPAHYQNLKDKTYFHYQVI